MLNVTLGGGNSEHYSELFRGKEMAPHHFAYPKVTPVGTSAAQASGSGSVKLPAAQSPARS